MKIVFATIFAMAAILSSLGSVRAELLSVVDFATTMDMPFLSVGNTGNTDDTHGSGYGAVSYTYGIGKFEVTTGQYTEFLNAVGADDTYGLYNERMSDPSHIEGDDFPFGGCNIQRSGTAGSYTYSVAAGWEDRPVNYVSWGDVARYSNWLTNGMPTGAQDLSTTEDGAYPLNGATSSSALKTAIANRNSPVGSETFYYMPAEDEWYKAALHKNDGDTANYYLYGTSSDTTPSYIGDGGSLSDPDPGNVATYDGDGGIDGIGAPFYRTLVGEHENTQSPYGAFDMAGNIGEWTQGLGFGSFAIVRGGEFAYGDSGLAGSYRRIRSLTRESGDIGFRLASTAPAGGVAVPEPATLLLALFGLSLLGWRRLR
ncbi:MAG: SUMF1/EgtB/PvdO family nonheme iron enzyme [Pirellulales bacterium]|nr:SUMF1/EgtB/PvdO family nonheme iron enzyme [Pirellulales bacterium]